MSASLVGSEMCIRDSSMAGCCSGPRRRRSAPSLAVAPTLSTGSSRMPLRLPPLRTSWSLAPSSI
eukprot:8900418-Alexandrium_andersonii.AAC.1